MLVSLIKFFKVTKQIAICCYELNLTIKSSEIKSLPVCFNRVLSGLNTTNAFSFSSSIVINFEGYALFFTFFTVVEFSRYVTSKDISTRGILLQFGGGTFLGTYQALFFCASRPFTRLFFWTSKPLTWKPEGQPLKLHEEREKGR